jgi:transposase
LTDEINAIDQAILPLLEQHAARLLNVPGVGPEVASSLLIAAGDNPERLRNKASSAAPCGATPLPASSGKTNRHRLNPGGRSPGELRPLAHRYERPDVRPAHPTLRPPAYHRALSKREILRCLKRYIAREVFSALPATTALDRP